MQLISVMRSGKVNMLRRSFRTLNVTTALVGISLSAFPSTIVVTAGAISFSTQAHADQFGGAGGMGGSDKGSGGGGGNGGYGGGRSDGAGGLASPTGFGGVGVSDGGSNGGGGGGAGEIGGAGGSSSSGGAGGQGGAHGIVGSDVWSLPAIGAAGASGQPNLGSPADGGGGGGGGFGAVVTGPVSDAVLSQSATGGIGGAGGNSTAGTGTGGGGGGGGAGAVFLGAVNGLSVEGAVTGGLGGAGGNASGSIGDSGGGGGGGHGLVFQEHAQNIVINGTVTGGIGGAAGSTPASIGRGGSGGSGGTGIVFNDGGKLEIAAGGAILGGIGGSAGAGNPDGGAGAGGEGITGAGLSIINGGSIAGGLAGDGALANAISFSGGDNSLTLESGYNIDGNVVVDTGAGATATLILGGANTSIFDASSIGTQYQGFSSFQKAGSSTWVLNGPATTTGPWTLSDGTLQITANGSLGTGNVTFDGGTLQAKNTIAFYSLDNSVILNSTGGTLDSNSTSLALLGDITDAGGTPAGTLTITDSSLGAGGAVFMSGNNTYSGQTHINSTGQLFAASTTGLSANSDFTVDGSLFLAGHDNTIRSLSGTGEVINFGGAFTTLTIAPSSGTTTFSGTIADGAAGALAITKTGNGAQILSGTNTYTGGTTVSGGVLQISSDTNLGDVSGALTLNGGTLQATQDIGTSRAITLGVGGGTFDPVSTTLTLNTDIGGAGGLTVGSGGGEVVLTGTNSYAGGTTIMAGSALQLGTDGPGGLKTKVLGSIDNSGTVAVANADLSGVTSIDNSFSFYFMNDTSAASATISNDGVIIFSNTSTAESANITSRGLLFLSDESTLGSASLVVDGAGGPGIAFLEGDSAGGTSTILVKNGGVVGFLDQGTPGQADLNAENGFFDISATAGANGDGVVTAGSISGTVDGAFYLGENEFVVGNNNKSTSFAGLLSDGAFDPCGCGIVGPLVGAALTKVGTGTLTLSGTGTYTGGTLVSAGKLVVNGTFAGPVDVDAGATLGGTGMIGDTTIASGGIIAPGNSPGTLHVAGDLLLSSGSIYDAEILSNGVADQIAVTGTATVTGSRVAVATLDPETSYRNGQTYTILTADGEVKGAFADVVSSSAFLDFTLDTQANEVDLTIGLKDNGGDPGTPGTPPLFKTVADTRNQKATAGALDTLEQSGPSLALYNDLLMLDAASARAAFDGLSGEIHASIKTGLIDDSRFVRDAMDERLRAAFDGVGADEASPVLAYGPDGAKALAPADTSRLAAWGSAFGSWSDYDGNGNAAGMDTSTGGFVTGLDGLISDSWRLGLLAGYSHSSYDVDDRSSSGESDTYHLGVYGGTQWNSLSFRSGLAYSWHSIDTSRHVAFPGFDERLPGDYDAGTFQAFGELGYRIDTTMASFEPFANLAHVRLHTDGFDEDGGAAALSANSQTTDTTFTTLGLRASSSFTLGGMATTARGMLGWKHAFGDISPVSTQSFTGSDAFTIAGVPLAQDSAVIEAGLDLSLSKNATLGIAWQGQFGNGNSQNGLNATLGVKF